MEQKSPVQKTDRLSIFLNYGLIATANLSGFIITPALVRGLGNPVYGVYLLAFLTSSFFTAYDFGVGTSVIRNIVSYRLKKDKKGLENYIFWVFVSYIGFAVVVFLICLAVLFLSPLLFGMSLKSHEVSLFEGVFFILSVNCLLSFIQNFMFSVVTGFNRLAFTRVLAIAKAMVRAIAIVLLMVFGANPYMVALLDVLMTVLSIIAFFVYFLRLKIKIGPHRFDSGLFRKTVRNMIQLYIQPISDNLYWYLCSVMVAIYVGAGAVSQVTIAVTFCHVLIQLTATLSYYKISVLSEIWAAHDEDAYYSYLFDSARLQTILVGGTIIGFIFAGQMFLKIWIGEVFNISYDIALICMVALFIPLSQSMLEMTFFVRDRYSARTAIVAAGTVFNALFLWILIPRFGVLGTAYSVSATLIIFNFIATNIYYHKAKIPVRAFNLKVVLKILPSVLASIAVGLAGYFLFPHTLIFTIINCGAAGVVYLLLVYLTYITNAQREYCKERLSRVCRFLR